MRRYISAGVLFAVLLMIVASTLSPVVVANKGFFGEIELEASLSEQESVVIDRPSGSLFGGGGPKPLIFPPSIDFCGADPPTQNVGSNVQLYCIITDMDPEPIAAAWVEVTDPDGVLVGNFSMTYDMMMMRWYYDRVYYKAGTYTYNATALDAEGLYDHRTGFTFRMIDSNPPTINNETASPSPQELGQPVNITCDVVDDGVVDEVWVEVFDPFMNPVGNFSMIYDSSTGNWSYEQSYLAIGTFTYVITAYDSGGNYDVVTGTFQVRDTTPPTISDPQENPNPQEIGSFVNISAVVSDLDSVVEVRLRVVDPFGGEVGNWSMSYDSVNDRYYYNRTYGVLGLYDYEIWARDPSGNWAVYYGTFRILPDVTPPTITGAAGNPSPQEVFFDVNITATITDNTAVWGAWVEIHDPLGGLVGNFSMGYDGISGLYFYEQTYDLVGTYTFTIWANDTYDWWSSSPGSFVIQDTTLPVVDQVTAIPDPQEVFNQVNISCRVTDNWAVQEAWVEVRDPLGALVGNFSMLYDSGTGRWSHEQAYGMLGTYTFTIWASDTEGNWGTDGGSFAMQDTTPPAITGTAATPNPQQSNGNVNITCTVMDNYQFFEAYVEVIDPFATILGNFSMLWDSISSQFYYEQPYWELGDHNYTIWASDTSNNWDSATGNFTIIDTTNPVISDVQRIPQPQEVHFSVNVSALVTDNYMVERVVIDILDPLGFLVINTDMAYDGVSGRYYYEAIYDMVGTYTCNLWTRDPMNNQDTAGCDFDMVDTTLPVISDVRYVPDPGEVNAPVNMSAIITDNYQLDAGNVWINITDPFSFTVGNFSMLYDAVNERFYHEETLSQLGMHSFRIWAADTGGLWTSTQSGLLIVDSTPPLIFGITSVPDPQEVFGSVNISADVIDNYQIQRVDINIKNPSGGPVGNFSMLYDSGNGRWSYEQAYDMLGTYTFTIWGRDTRNNWGSNTGSFVMQDTTPPLIQNTIASPDPQDAGGLVRIDTQVTDNFQLGDVYVEVLDPFMVLIINTTMTAGATQWYEQAYSELGTHTFTITAWDSVGLFSIDTGTFVINDVSPPILGTPTETPDPQEVYGNVNVTVDVSDNYQVQSVDIGIRDPTAALVGNFSMIDLGTGVYSYEQAYDMLGTYTCTIWAIDTSGNPASAPCAFFIRDTTQPVISNPIEDPQPQNAEDNVNISAVISDNFQLSFARLEVINPNMVIVGNNSMLYDAGSGRYYWDDTYDIVGTYTYNIYAWDSSGNVGSYSGTFAMGDQIPPTLSLTQALPDPQEVHGNVNITSRIEDNLDVIQTAHVEITDPTMAFVGNFTMTYHPGANKFFFLTSYDMLGTYTFVIWASDPLGNWATDGGSFVIQDTTPPDITNIVTTSPQEIDVGAIDITATVTDNFDPSSAIQVWISIWYPDATPFENVSMSYDSINDEFYYQSTFQVELGTYDFDIWAEDGQGNGKLATGSFVIQDTTDPIADAGVDQNVDQGVLVTFDGSGSSDNDPLFDTTANYTWSFFDLGSVDIYGISPTYTFTRGGDYMVTLRVTDRQGNWGEDTVSVHVVAGPSPPINPRVTDPTDSTLTMSWDRPATYTDGTSLPESDIKGYSVYRSDSADGTYVEIFFVNALTYTDVNLTANTTYYYKVTCWSLAENIESEMTTWKSGATTPVTLPGDGDGDEQDMMLYVLILMLILVIVVILIVAIAMLRKKKPEEPPRAYEEEYYYEEDLPPPPPR